MEFNEYLDLNMITYNSVPLQFDTDEEEVVWLCSRLELVKQRMRENHERLREAMKGGGISPEEEYPEIIDGEKITYLIPNNDTDGNLPE